MAPLKSGKGRNFGKLVKIFGSTLLGETVRQQPITTATGGIEIIDGLTKYHVFHPNTGQPNTFTVSSTMSDSGTLMKILVIGGGGSGSGPYVGGGGGAGGVWYASSLAITNGTYPISVGDGSITSDAGYQPGLRGGTTTFATPGYTVTSTGGGGGNKAYYSHDPTGIRDGGSGGGGGVQFSQPGAAGSPISNGPYPGWTFYGNGGGYGAPYAANYDSGGGGGAGSQGADGSNSGGGGSGGAGQAFPEFPGPVIAPAIPTTTHRGVARSDPERTEFINAVGPTGIFAGGGGGGRIPEAGGMAPGGTGGGGRSAMYGRLYPAGLPAAGQPGVNYTGSGAGANCLNRATYPDYCGQGGTGIVIVKYDYDP